MPINSTAAGSSARRVFKRWMRGIEATNLNSRQKGLTIGVLQEGRRHFADEQRIVGGTPIPSTMRFIYPIGPAAATLCGSIDLRAASAPLRGGINVRRTASAPIAR